MLDAPLRLNCPCVAGEGLSAGDIECCNKSRIFTVLTMASILSHRTLPRNLYCRVKFIAGDRTDFYFSPGKLINQIKFAKCETVSSVHYYYCMQVRQCYHYCILKCFVLVSLFIAF